MSTLVVSLETLAEDWDNLSEITKTELTKWIDTNPKVDKEKSLSQIKSSLGFSPFTAKILSIAIYDIERNLEALYFCSEYLDEENVLGTKVKLRTEKEILEDFWEGVRGYDTFVTFNGRSFTLPFIYHRSAILKIKPTVEIAKERYVTKQTWPHHVDLLDEFTFHGAISKKPSLAILCEAYGVDLSHVSGEQLLELFQQKRFQQLAKNNESKARVIKQLYEIWLQYHAPLSFINTIDN